MDNDELLTVRMVEEWDAAFGRLLELIPRSKKALAFRDASLVEGVAKRWAQVALATVKKEGE